MAGYHTSMISVLSFWKEGWWLTRIILAILHSRIIIRVAWRSKISYGVMELVFFAFCRNQAVEEKPTSSEKDSIYSV